MSDDKFLVIKYRSVLNASRLDSKKKHEWAARSGETAQLVVKVSAEEYAEIKKDNFEVVANVFRKVRNIPSNVSINYGQDDTVTEIEYNSENYAYSDNPAYAHFHAADLVSVENATETDLYIQRLKSHDWTYAYSDDRRVYNAGCSSHNVISSMRTRLDPTYEIWNSIAPDMYKVQQK